jgi:hypothetical protein
MVDLLHAAPVSVWRPQRAGREVMAVYTCDSNLAAFTYHVVLVQRLSVRGTC